MRSTRNWLPKRDPWAPPDHDDQVIWAWRAFAKGEATQSQQLTVRDYLMYLTGASEEFQDLSFRPGEEGRRATDFAEGKRFVGVMLRKLARPELTPRGEHEVDVPRMPGVRRVRRRATK
jgi:hypothetical protein